MRIVRTLAAAVVIAGVASCSTTAPHPERWRLRITARDGTFVGGLVLELTPQNTNDSCVSGNPLILVRVLEKHGFGDDPVAQSAGLSLDHGRLYADLTLGWCDHTLAVSGPIRGNRASGEAYRSTLAGRVLVGRFVAERVPQQGCGSPRC
jgi:hypothetical protein